MTRGDEDTVPRRRFDPSSFSPAERFERFRASLSARWDVVVARDIGQPEYSAQADIWELGAVTVVSASASAQTIVRDPSLVRASQMDDYVLQLVARQSRCEGRDNLDENRVAAS